MCKAINQNRDRYPCRYSSNYARSQRRKVILGNSHGVPVITSDGATIANEIVSSDVFQNIGAWMAKEVATKTKDAVGDGATTAILIAQAIVKYGMKKISAGANPFLVNKGIEEGVNIAISSIIDDSLKVNSISDICAVATSCSGDYEIGKLIATIMEKLTINEGIIVGESQTIGTYWEIDEVMQFDSSYISPCKIHDQDRKEYVIERPYIFIVDRKITSADGMAALYKKALLERCKIVIVADGVEGDAFEMLNGGNMTEVITCVTVKTPERGDSKRQMLEDISLFTDGKIISEEIEGDVNKVALSQLGRANLVKVQEEKTIIVGENEIK